MYILYFFWVYLLTQTHFKCQTSNTRKQWHLWKQIWYLKVSFQKHKKEEPANNLLIISKNLCMDVSLIYKREYFCQLWCSISDRWPEFEIIRYRFDSKTKLKNLLFMLSPNWSWVLDLVRAILSQPTLQINVCKPNGR